MNPALLPPLDPTQPRYGYRPAAPAPPAVSIITPYYNTGPLFLETVRSVLRQSLQQWEWIIVNDGSDDPAALRVLLALRSADARIRVLDQPNRGLPAARNAGVAASRAPLLFFLDSDDLIASTALEKLAWTLASYPQSAFATSWYALFGHQNLAWPRGFDTRYAFLYEHMATASALVRREVFETVGGFEEPRRQGLEDYEFWLRCAAHGFWGHDVREFLIWIRSKAPQTYRTYRWAFQDDPQHLRAFRREMRARYPQLFRAGLPRPERRAALFDTHAIISTALPFPNHLCPQGQRRVLLLLPWMRMGGSERFALDLAAGLTARGDRVSVCLLLDAQHTWLEELQRITSDVFNLATFLAPADYPRFLHYLIASRGITTVLISNSLLGYQLLPYLRAHCPDVAFVDYLHLEEEHWRHGGFPRAAIEHDGLLDLHITSSQHLQRWMVERGAAAGRIEVCTINIDTRCWAPSPEVRAAVRARLGVADDLPLIVFAGRLAPQKRLQLAAEILRRLRRSGAPFVCLVAGDGPLRGWLRRYVRSHRLGDCVRLLGAVPHEQVRELLAASDLLLLPSAHEGIALILYEALAMGVVPVAADVGGQHELVTPECGVLIPPGENELEAYVDALQLLIADRGLRTRMARAGRARVVAHFTADQMLDRMQALLDRAVEYARTAPRPPVSPGAGLAAATLAIEHYQLDARLRRLLPVRIVLALRDSPAWGWLGTLSHLRAAVERSDRALYVLRRAVMQWLRRARRAIIPQEGREPRTENSYGRTAVCDPKLRIIGARVSSTRARRSRMGG